MGSFNDVYENLRSISKGDVDTLKRVTDDFAESVTSAPEPKKKNGTSPAPDQAAAGQ
jgi:hypothetical protein